MIRYLFLFAVSLVIVGAKAGPGKLLLIGGGSEKDTENSWNHAAYKWAVDNSANKKVAIIAFGSSTAWLPDYFMNECGATLATNFDISSTATADAQATYDDLMTYDVIFLKGGDQYNYYSTYKGTKTQQAIIDKYNAGGVICGTSAGLAVLSGVIYTAQFNSAYSDDCLKNPYHNDIQLANDFFNFFPGYIFDSHFTIRGRFGRLLAFMANWKFTQNENIKGIGVDEMTAMSIDENNLGKVYGIGSANIYEAFYDHTFSQNETKLIADSVKVTQLIQGCSINFSTGTISGFSQSRTPQIKEESGNYTIYASGSDVLSSNTGLIDDLVNQSANASDNILIITGSNQSLAETYKTALTDAEAANVVIYSATSDMASNADFESAISTAKKIIFVNNYYADIMAFFEAGSAGLALKNKMISNKIILAFIGDNSRFIGRTVVTNYLTTDAAYNGDFIIKPGFNLLKTSVVIPNTFISSDFYENTSAAVPYAMITDTLTYGIWLNKDNYLKYEPNSEDKPHFYASGSSPVIILKNKGTKTGFSVQTAYGDGLDNPPNFSGFENMTLSLIDESTPYQVGNTITITSVKDIQQRTLPSFNYMIRNHQLIIDWPDNKYSVSLYNLSGQLINSGNYQDRSEIPLTGLKQGIYIAKMQGNKSGDLVSKKIIIH
ncbi:MAG: Type 1 glutamine amidotransferase-like domain-containing protein [Bacteroidales bacterium]|nr:Type 1 glutamine amidotransferase-like domain-containing protein [Bacteroidales bacterium]